MTESKFNLVVPKDHNGTPIEMVFREGKAEDQLPNKEPVPVDITGTIESPLRYLEKREALIDPYKAKQSARLLHVHPRNGILPKLS